MPTNKKQTKKVQKTVQTEQKTETVFIKYESTIGTIEKTESGIEIFHDMENSAYETMVKIGTNAEKQKAFTDSLKKAEKEQKIRSAKRKSKKAENDESVTLTDEEKEFAKMNTEMEDDALRVLKAEQNFLLAAVKIGGKRRGKSFFD